MSDVRSENPNRIVHRAPFISFLVNIDQCATGARALSCCTASSSCPQYLHFLSLPNPPVLAAPSPDLRETQLESNLFSEERIRRKSLFFFLSSRYNWMQCLQTKTLYIHEQNEETKSQSNVLKELFLDSDLTWRETNRKSHFSNE